MAFPFGGHPTLRQFLEFAEGKGCTSTLLVRTAKSGKAYRALEIANGAGGRAIIVDPDLDEHLSPSMVTYLQRRLAISTPFAARPEPTKTEGKEVSE